MVCARSCSRVQQVHERDLTNTVHCASLRTRKKHYYTVQQTYPILSAIERRRARRHLSATARRRCSCFSALYSASVIMRPSLGGLHTLCFVAALK